ncbi:substrate-binding periplasmic protein [Duganella sacchari]|uniref:substrate-binding periplasmic protein n=1 Tax=Duganella sacchari TaxID=551987 RepID=UPI000932F9BC|nr:transporter substrate-binding domain-containing protein [Duganella sacchari]
MIRKLAMVALLPLSLRAMAADPMMVVTEEFSPYSYLAQGKVVGYSTEVVSEALQRAGLTYSVQVYPWARAFHLARSQPNVLIFSIVRTPEREAQFHWLAQLAPRSTYLYKLKTRHDIQVRTVEDLRPYRIAATRGDIVEEQLHQFGLTADLAAGDASSIRKLMAGRVDLMVASELSIKGICGRTQVRCALLERTMPMPGLTEYYVAASLSTPAATVQALRTGLEKLKSSGFMQRTADKYGVSLK